MEPLFFTDATHPLERPLIISDVHLQEGRTKTLMRILKLLDHDMGAYRELVILGDLFESYYGSESLKSPMGTMLCAAINVLVNSGRRVFVMPGDRDKMLDDAFYASSGAIRVPDPWVIQVKDERVLFTHGDRFVEKDAAQLAWRRLTDDVAWEDRFWSLPFEERAQFWALTRQDAVRQAGQAFLHPYPRRLEETIPLEWAETHHVRRVIHGHIGHQGAHCYSTFERWVVSNWNLDDENHYSASYLTFMPQGRPQITLC